MKPRLIRALQRGGVTSEIGPERWGVWRNRDRRGRIIGVLTGAEIDVLRTRESLKPLGDGQPPIFIWPESILERPDAPPDRRAWQRIRESFGRTRVRGRPRGPRLGGREGV